MGSALSRTAVQAWQLVLICSGGPESGKKGEMRWDADHLVVRPTSRPWEAVLAAGEADWLRAVTLHLPVATVGVPDQVLQMLSGGPVTIAPGPGALVARFLEEIAEYGTPLASASAGRLGSAAIDLAAAFIGELAHKRGLLPLRTNRATLVEEIKAFIVRHLKDSYATPARIAEAHHISVRYLHELFRPEGETVAAFIRHHRLERCCADLASRSLAGQSVADIARNWGFQDPTVFGRIFKKAYGLPPGEYRRRVLGR
jgi:AraC-like DNA-binding protein